MWKRLAGQLRPFVAAKPAGGGSDVSRTVIAGAGVFSASIPALSFSSLASGEVKKRIEDVMPIATGFEREEIEGDLQGIKRFDMDAPVGPFGTKEAPAIIHSYYNKRIIGCPGGEGEGEHDVVWFWLEKEKPHECPVCSQYFKLEVVGDGGDPVGESDDEHEHHH